MGSLSDIRGSCRNPVSAYPFQNLNVRILSPAEKTFVVTIRVKSVSVGNG